MEDLGVLLLRVKDKNSRARNPVGNRVKMGTQDIQRSQLRYRQGSGKNPRSLVRQGSIHRYTELGTGKVQAKIQGPKNRQRDRYTGRKREYRQQYKRVLA